MAQLSFIHLNTRLSFLIIGGTAIAIGIGRTAAIRDMPSFSLTSYLASKLSGLIPWRSATTANANRRLEGAELGEQNGMNRLVEIAVLRKALAEAKEKEEQNAGLEEELSTLRREVGCLKKDLEESRAERKDVEALMATIDELRAKEPQTDASASTVIVGDVFCTALDRISQEEAVKLTVSLNNEILRVARSVTQAFSQSPRPAPRLPSEEIPEEIKEATSAVTEVLGARMVEFLQSPQYAPVQMALQVSMAAHVHWIVSSWYIENPDEEHFLSEIYARVRETEEQSVSGRWRALTRTHLRRTIASEPDLTLYMIDAFMNVILTAGWHNDAMALQEYLSQHFAAPINQVIKAAQRLNVAIGEEIASCDLETLYIPPDILFNGLSMDISESQSGGHQHHGGSGETDRQERVLCTTDLGLVRAERKVGVVGEWEEAVLLKPSVVLQ